MSFSALGKNIPCLVILSFVALSHVSYARNVDRDRASFTTKVMKSDITRRHLLQEEEEEENEFSVPFPPDLSLEEPVGCIRPTNVGLCILPQSLPDAVRAFAEQVLEDEKTVFTIGVLLDLGVNFTIDADGITFRLTNRVSCNISTSGSGGSQVSVRTTAIATSTGAIG